MPALDIPILVLGTILSYDGVGFDATRTFSPSVTQTGSGYSMLFAGLPAANNIQIGLATSPDHTSWIKHPSSPVITNAGSQAWAGFRELPVSLMYQGGTFKLWFYGNDANAATGNGFGYATSADGITWNQNPSNPIRFALNGGGQYGYSLNEVVYFNGQYHAFYTHGTDLGPVLYRATSMDGINFSGDQIVSDNPTYRLTAATSFTNTNGEGFLSVWQALDGSNHYSLSYNSIDLTLDGGLIAPLGFDIRDVLVEGNVMSFYAERNVGNLTWCCGNLIIEYGVAALPAPVPEPSSALLIGTALMGLGAFGRRGWRFG